jgi:hypothetical protein
MRKLTLVCALAVLCPCMAEATQREAITTIAAMYTYTQYGGGDVQILVANPVTGCSGGFWLKATDSGFKTTYALLLSAYHAGNQLRIGGEDADIWTGSGAPHCRMTYAGIYQS